MSCGTGTVGYIGNAPKQATKVFEPTIARTLIALAGGQGGKTGLYHLGYGIRKLKPKEALRIMGFCNMDYIKLKHANISDNQIYKVSGNSIVVDVLCRIFSSIFNLYPEYSSFK
jgi:DNA (cytosine-5)-methyltransferase 1